MTSQRPVQPSWSSEAGGRPCCQPAVRPACGSFGRGGKQAHGDHWQWATHRGPSGLRIAASTLPPPVDKMKIKSLPRGWVRGRSFQTLHPVISRLASLCVSLALNGLEALCLKAYMGRKSHQRRAGRIRVAPGVRHLLPFSDGTLQTRRIPDRRLQVCKSLCVEKKQSLFRGLLFSFPVHLGAGRTWHRRKHLEVN